MRRTGRDSPPGDPTLKVDQLDKLVTLGNQRGVVGIGNVDVTIFERATRAEIEAEVRRCIGTVRAPLPLRAVHLVRAPAARQPRLRPVVHGGRSRLRALREDPGPLRSPGADHPALRPPDPRNRCGAPWAPASTAKSGVQAGAFYLPQVEVTFAVASKCHSLTSSEDRTSGAVIFSNSLDRLRSAASKLRLFPVSSCLRGVTLGKDQSADVHRLAAEENGQPMEQAPRALARRCQGVARLETSGVRMSARPVPSVPCNSRPAVTIPYTRHRRSTELGSMEMRSER